MDAGAAGGDRDRLPTGGDRGHSGWVVLEHHVGEGAVLLVISVHIFAQARNILCSEGERSKGEEGKRKKYQNGMLIQ